MLLLVRYIVPRGRFTHYGVLLFTCVLPYVLALVLQLCGGNGNPFFHFYESGWHGPRARVGAL